MAGKLKNRERFGAAYDKELLVELRKLAKETRIPISRLLDEAIEDLVKKHKNKEKESKG